MKNISINYIIYSIYRTIGFRKFKPGGQRDFLIGKEMIMDKRIIAAVCGITLAASGFNTLAQTPEVYIDGIKQSYDVNPIIRDGRTLVPMRAIFEVLGAEVAWNDKTQSVTAVLGNDEIKLTIGNAEAVLNGESVSLDAAPQLIDGRTLIPLRFVSEALGAKVSWDEKEEAAVISSKENDKYWWYKFPTQSESENIQVHARSVRSNFGGDFNWGHLGQFNAYEEQYKRADNEFKDKKIVSYYEAMGQSMIYSVAYKKDAKGEFTNFYNHEIDGKKIPMPEFNAWGWTEEKVGNANCFDYFGPHIDVNGSEVDGGYNKQNDGIKNPVYPNGESAAGYDEKSELPYPLNAKIYDMSMGKNINGVLHIEPSMEFENSKGLAEMTVGTPELPKYVGYDDGDKAAFRMFNLNKDISAPFWQEYEKETAENFARYKLDGAWFDNYSPWDNFAFTAMFGDYSVYKFKDYLKNNFTEAELEKMGISDASSFDVREYMKKKAEKMGAEDSSNVSSREYQSDEWIDDPIWNAYKIYKSNEGAEHLKGLYKIMKDATKDKEDGFAVFANDMPKVNHGWVKDSYLDVVGCEVGTNWDLTFGSRGIGLPPVGKMAVYEKAAREQMKGPYPVIWFYNGGGAKDRTELGKVLQSEAFANNTFVKRAANCVGTDESHIWLNDFADENESLLSGRYDYYDTAIMMSTQNQLLMSVPSQPITGSDMNRQYHMQGMWGFAHALTDANVPYRIIPEWKVNSQSLKEIKTLILPCVEAMDDEMLPVLEEYVKNGGKLILTGAAGTRCGTKGNFKKRENGLFEDLLMRDTSVGASVKYSDNMNEFDTEIYSKDVGKGKIIWTAEPIGFDYYSSTANRDEMLKQILDITGRSEIYDGSALNQTVGSFLYRTADSKVIWADIVNYDVSDDDVVTPAKNISFKIKVPYGRQISKITAISPEGNKEIARWSSDGDFVGITLDEVKYYTSVRMELR